MQAAINASRVDLPATLRSNPTYRKANPADAPVIILALTSQDAHAGADLRRGVQHRAASACRRSTASATSRSAAARCRRCASSCCRSRCNRYGISSEDVRAAIQAAQREPAEGRDRGRRPPAADLHARRRRGAPRDYAPPGDRLAQRRRGAAARRRRGRSTASRTRARWACSTASRRSSCWSRASPAPT